jgi:hypothetical protein
MSRGAAGRLAIGALVFLGFTLFEQLPVLGWLGFVLSIAAWLALTGDLRRGGGTVAEAALLGLVTGFVAALSAWLMQLGNLFGLDTGGGARVGAVFGTVGSSIGILLWPVFGAMVCALAAAVRRGGHATRRRFPET